MSRRWSAIGAGTSGDASATFFGLASGEVTPRGTCRKPEEKARFLELLSEADVLVHGYCPEGIDGLVSPEERQRAKPDLVEVAFRAYGWTGPWRLRRGFDAITEFSTGRQAIKLGRSRSPRRGFRSSRSANWSKLRVPESAQ